MPAVASRVERVRMPRTASVVLLAAWCAACSTPRDPIVVSEGVLVLENQTRREWRNVRITINDHFTGGAPTLLPGGLLTAPLRNFETGFGQPFDRGRMSVFKVRVSATDIDGEPVALSWGK
jgi:hypothetical protein